MRTMHRMPNQDFNPRPPRGGRLRTGKKYRKGVYFNPRPPRGGRPGGIRGCSLAILFQSTPSARRATDFTAYHLANFDISIHALREEGDS